MGDQGKQHARLLLMITGEADLGIPAPGSGVRLRVWLALIAACVAVLRQLGTGVWLDCSS